MIRISKTICLLSLVLRVYGECYRSGAKIKCTDTFEHEPLTLEIDVKSCKAPVKINVKLDIRGVTHNKEFTGDQDIPLPELSISGLTDIFLTVNAYPQDNGDLQLQIGLKRKVEIIGIVVSTKSILTILSSTIPKSDCNAFLIWWNSQSLAVQIVIPSSAGLLLIVLLIGCYYCCCQEGGSRNEDVQKQPTFIIPPSIQLQNPAENQFKYKLQVNEIA